MASRSERRAALAAVPLTPSTDELAARTSEAEPTRESEEEPTMKIQFQSVLLDMTIPRLNAEKGLAAQDTTFFDVARTGTMIELDTASGLVKLWKGDAVCYVPREKVQRFGDVYVPASTDER